MVEYAVSRGALIRQSYAPIQVSRAMLGYRSRLEARDAELGATLREIAFRHRGYGIVSPGCFSAARANGSTTSELGGSGAHSISVG